MENLDLAYRAELQAWTTGDPRRRDGVPAPTEPHEDAGAHDGLSIRDFDAYGMGWLSTETRTNVKQCLLLLGTRQDTPAAWLRAGEHWNGSCWRSPGGATSPARSPQLIEVATTNALLRHELQLTMHPHVLLRVGRAPMTPSSRRRRFVDMLEVSR
ncbi:MAG: hypothetical protein WKF47_16475 [Geodermatophilaceae bacterium]